MPQLDRIDQLPLPNLSLYAGFSGLALFYAFVYALTSSQDNFIMSVLWSDVWCTAAVLNMSCCCFFLLAKIIHSLVFGSLQHVEHQHMRDKFWNFVFYKFIFVFGVMNVQEMHEMLWWCVWFAILGTLHLTEQLCRDRFQFLSFSPNTFASSHAKIILLLSLILLSCGGLFMVCAVVGWQYGFNHFSFLYSEVFILFARALHSIIRHLIHLWDMRQDGAWENRSTYTYYTELILEVAILCVDFIHHIHMLLWANMFLSVASLILLMKLRFLYQELQRRFKRHRNYILVSKTLENRFVHVTSSELLLNDEVCPICWERMKTARKLPCGHIFHMVCLRAWLEQDTVCPTCRRSLSDDLREGGGQPNEPQNQEEDRGRGRRLRRNMRNARNWLLRFNGASIASWLPTFSLELHREEDPHWISDAAELHRVAQQIHSMFSHVPLQAITLDLADTHSVSLTVDRILNNGIYIPGEGERDESGAVGEGGSGQVEGGAVSIATTPSNNGEMFTAALSTPLTPRVSHDSLPPQLCASDDSTHATSSETSLSSDWSGSSYDESDNLSHDQSHDQSHVHESCSTSDLCEEKESVNETQRSDNPPGPTEPPGSSSPPKPGLRLRKSAVSQGEDLPVVTSIQSEKEVSSDTHEKEDSPPLHSHPFSSLQERKAELLKNAKRRYLMKEEQSNSN